MVLEREILGGRVRLRSVALSDCTERYLSWMTDPETNRYMETRWNRQTLDAIRSFVQQMRESPHSWLLAIIYNENHVGNIKIGPIHDRYRNADLSYFIGDKNCLGVGVATKAVELAVRFAFQDLKLHRLQAGVFSDNFASRRVLEKNGFKCEAIFKEKYFLTSEKDWTDCYEYVILNK